MFVILQINRQEAFAMRKIVGMDEVKKTYSKRPTYFLVESKNNLKELEKYRKSLLS